MKKFWLLLMAMLTVCAIFLSSCSEDPDDDDSDGSGNSSVSDPSDAIENQLPTKESKADKELLAEKLNDGSVKELLQELNDTKINLDEMLEDKSETAPDEMYLKLGDNYASLWIKGETFYIDLLDGMSVCGGKVEGNKIVFISKLEGEDLDVEFGESETLSDLLDMPEEFTIEEITEGAIEDIIDFIDEFIEFEPTKDHFKFENGYYMLDMDYVKGIAVDLLSDNTDFSKSELEAVANLIDFKLGFAVKSEKITAVKAQLKLDKSFFEELDDMDSDLEAEVMEEISFSVELAFGEAGVSPAACIFSATVKTSSENDAGMPYNGFTVTSSESIVTDENGIPTAVKYDVATTISCGEIVTNWGYDDENEVYYLGQMYGDVTMSASFALDLDGLVEADSEIFKANAKFDITNISYKYQKEIEEKVYDEYYGGYDYNYTYVDVKASEAEKFFSWTEEKIFNYLDASAEVAIFKDENSILNATATLANGTTSVSVGGALTLVTELENVTLPNNEITGLLGKSIEELEEEYK